MRENIINRMKVKCGKSSSTSNMIGRVATNWTCNRLYGRATSIKLIVICLLAFCSGPFLSNYQFFIRANINYSVAETQDANNKNNFNNHRYYHPFNYDTSKVAAQKEHKYVMISNKTPPLSPTTSPFNSTQATTSQSSSSTPSHGYNNINSKSYSNSNVPTSASILSKSSEFLSKLQSERHLAPLPPKQQLIDRQQPIKFQQNQRSHSQQKYTTLHLDQQHQVNSIHQQQLQQQQQPPLSLLTKICIGTSNKLANQHNRTDHYQNLVDRYKDCTYVIGNLEITWVEKGRDLSFLETIREISGYLLIANVEVERIRLPNLQIIRGRDQYNHDGRDYAFFLIDNELSTVELPNLTEILSGSYGSYYNKNLCYLNTINWEEILHPPYESYNVYDGIQPSCPSCNPICSSGSCWGEGPDNCQRFTKIGCSCGQGRCFGPSPGDCCHSYCAGGCTGPKESHCLACKNFYDDGTCVPECPSMMRYMSEAFEWVTNPKGKYAFGAFCVKDCPEHLLRDNGACVRTCPANKRSVNGECVSCLGPCPKQCQGVEVIHSGNIDPLINCTLIEGSITISDLSFYGSQDSSAPSTGTTNANATTAPAATKYKPMHPNRLEALKNLREITGFLNIQASHPDFKNLSFFRNLMYIGGRQATDYSLSIIKTSLVSLNLHSLRKVKSGKILIEDNKNLCFADTIDWAQTNITRKDEITTRNNAEPSKCRSLGLQCHEQCARDGCWGSGPDECLSCNNYKLDDYCVDNCSSSRSQIGLLSYVDGPRICKKCHPECAKGCRGSEAKNCFECKNVKDGPFCVPECPSHKYNKNGTCQACDPSCLDGCTGPLNKLGEGGCNSCAKVVLNSTDVGQLNAHCISAEESCPDGFYQEYVGPQVEGLLKSSSGKLVCRKCHHRCKSCTGMGTHTSVCTCAKYVAGEQCEESCPRDHYEDEQSRHCLKCSSECNGCFGPTEADCHTCRVYRIYHNPISQMQDTQQIYSTDPSTGIPDLSGLNGKLLAPRFNCTAQCPPDKPKRISDKSMLDPYCSEDDGVDSENTNKNALFIAYGIMLAFGLTGLACCLCICRFQQQNDKTLKLTMHLSGIDDVEPLHPSNLKPNLAPLRSIKESELSRGKELGSGIGGTVYQGLWLPEGREHKKPLPVAIKVLKNNAESKEFLDEAYIMASVKHPNLVRLLAVCMTPTHLMLVTQLMPLGCLLDYVQKHRDDIGSKNLFEWCKQIARGMAYLEENRMVHRDLALRNVLLQRNGLAVVSDFGLAKFLDIDQSEYHSGGGRLPIKWLAPECIRERIFTHKSDVWAFGVTVWELMTFGDRPFEGISTREVYRAIELGARLCQPAWMTAEVYKELYACWFYNPDERPDFKYLEQKFIKFAQDPERYLGICRTKGINYNLNIDSNGKGFSDCDDNLGEEYNSDINEFTEDDSQPPSAIAPELTPSTHNRLNEINVFGFEQQLRNNNQDQNNNNIISINDPESDSQQTATPICKSRTNLFPGSPRRKIDDEFFMASSKQSHKRHNHPTSIDINNNTDTTNCWQMIQTMSSNSLGHKSDQPTDGYDYLIPSLSPSTNEQHSQFGSFYESHYDIKSIPITPTSSKTNSTLPLRNPPHSAGPIGIQNEEYFLNGRVNYVNYLTSDSTSGQRLKMNADRLSASNNNIPHSLV